MTDNETTNCNWCGADKESSGYEMEHTDWNGIAVCDSCCEQSGHVCDDCSTLVHTDDTYNVMNNRTVCESCYESDYFYCEGCDYTYSNNDYGYDGYCSDCEQENDSNCDCGDPDCGSEGDYTEGIRPWGDAPDLMFHDKDGYSYSPRPNTYYMGMEIEVEGHVNTIIGEAMQEPTFKTHMWATTDATLGSAGVEIVTHPHTFEAWNKTFPWEEWVSRIHNDTPDQTQYASNGIHIHVSRTAFANPKGKVLASHIYKFMQFIQKNEDAIQHLSGRKGNDYCRWAQERDAVSRVSDSKTATSTQSYERYRPINTQNNATIELRFFDGRTDPVFMKRSIQFVHSVVEFTRQGSAHGKGRGWRDYVRYVRGHALRYPELTAYLNKDSLTLVTYAKNASERYDTVVMPRVKATVKRAREYELEQRIENDRIAAEREERLANPPICDCEYCVIDRQDAAPIMSRPSS